MANTDMLLEKLRDREFWVLSFVFCTLQDLKDMGLLQGGYDVDPVLRTLVDEARVKHGHSDPTEEEIDRAMAVAMAPPEALDDPDREPVCDCNLQMGHTEDCPWKAWKARQDQLDGDLP